MNKSYTARERAHLEAIKQLPCSVCDKPGPSEAHHIKQDNPYLCVALCASCHRDGHNGLHGQRFMWKLKKLDEIDALAITYVRLMAK